MSDTSRAVFLSYASHDAEAARRICDALRAAGVEVWFDQSELRGGDAWDAKIRKQIKECALFVPVISANTQARAEGYFRLEWKLAADRSHLIARDHPFLVPVVIDDTPNGSARVPEEFHAVQWTRVRPTEPIGAFCRQVRTLLGESANAPSASGQASPRPASVRPVKVRRAGGSRWPWLALAAVLAVLSVAMWRPWQKSGTSMAPSGEGALPADKSIAVLPFANLSPDHDNEFFADGIHEDLLTNLQNIRELRVVSRTSVLGFRGTTKKINDIARELNVAYVLSGSVRRDGNTVRVSAQLINARTDAQLWSPQPYDRDLSATGVFKIQSEIAQSIATALRTQLSPQEKNLIDQRPTENLAAYDLYLKSRALVSAPTLAAAAELLEEAVRLDPSFALAWARLSRVHGLLYSNRQDYSPARLEKVKAAIDTAVKLSPNHPEVLHSLGRYYYAGFFDFGRALEYYEQVARMQPNNADIWHSIGAVHRRQGRWRECVADFRRGVELDPGDTGNAIQLARTLQAGRRYDEARLEYQRLSRRLGPESVSGAFDAAVVSFQATGSVAEVNAFFAQLTPQQLVERVGQRKFWAATTGNFSEYFRLEESASVAASDEAGGLIGSTMSALMPALILAAQGDLAAARARLPDARARLEREPLNPRVWARVGMVAALRGEKEEAQRCARRAVELMPESKDAFSGMAYAASWAFVLAWTGDKDRAIAEYSRLLRLPFSGLNVHEMKRDPTYHPLRGDPRFEALLNDSKNNAPLF
jgi:TolB-like protein/cytochrome c-type biogenesis protein CcmH/NrfG